MTFFCRGVNDMPPIDVTWYDGLDNIPPVPAGFGSSDVDPNIPTVNGGKLQLTKLNPGKEIYTKTLTFKGGSHGSTLSIIPSEQAKEMAPKLPEVPKSPSNHFANFLLSVMAKREKRRLQNDSQNWELQLSLQRHFA